MCQNRAVIGPMLSASGQLHSGSGTSWHDYRVYDPRLDICSQKKKNISDPGDKHIFSHKHDDVIKWKYFPRHWPFVRGIHRSPVNSPHKGQWRGALVFSLICVWINDWVNNHEAGDLKRYRTHYDAIVMVLQVITRNTYVPARKTMPWLLLSCRQDRCTYLQIHCS